MSILLDELLSNAMRRLYFHNVIDSLEPLFLRLLCWSTPVSALFGISAGSSILSRTTRSLPPRGRPLPTS